MKKFQILLLVILLSFNVNLLAQKPGLYVQDRFLYTPSGEKLILKGFNAMIVYWDIHGDINFPEIEKTGANCVRIFWNLAYPKPNPSDLDKVLANCIKHNMIPIICLWDATGKWEKLQDCVDYWTSSVIAPILIKYEKNLIVNIANEAGNKSMGDEVYSAAYSSAVTQIRNAGIRTPLMIDADKWGRNANAVLDNGQYLLEQDPEHNLIFSWHLWDPKSWGTGTISQINRIIETAVEKNFCFVIGEFGPCENCDNCVSTQINWEHLIEKAYENEIGYLPWVWRWADCHSCITYSPGKFGNWTNSPWGESVSVTHQYSIKNTAVRPEGMITSVNNLHFDSHQLNIYPNPFSSEITFDFILQNPSKISLKIYDLLGNEIDNIENRNATTNSNKFSWKPKKIIPEGIYLYWLILETNNHTFIENGKLIKK